ncbi:MAG TPA: hypothetical protein DEB40_13420, partial [Elusimicrobia bacterium]|nr:hypothetical protein [Elusimicrobiota bacterium]
MNWEPLVERLAFGNKRRELSSCLGLYFSPETIYIAETRLAKDGKLAVDHLVRIPVPVPEGKAGALATGTLNTKFLTENQRLGALIRQSMSQIRWNSKHVMVTLSHHLGLLRYFTMPGIERRFWKSAVPVEAKKYIPIPLDQLRYDYQVVPLPADAGGRSRQGALVAVTQKQNLASISAMLEGLGLTVAGMEVAPCSVLKLWQTLGKGSQAGPYCQVHFDGGSVRILVADRGFPVFFREVFLGAEANISDQRKVDLGGCVAFAQKQLGVGAISQIWLSGSGANLSVWKDAFSRSLSLPVMLQDTPALLGIKGGDWGGYAAIGASLHFQASSAMTLDLGDVGRSSDEEKQTARDLLVAGGGLTALFLILGLFKLGLYEFRARELHSLQRNAEIEAVFQNKIPEEINGMFKSMREQLDLTKEICAEN